MFIIVILQYLNSIITHVYTYRIEVKSYIRPDVARMHWLHIMASKHYIIGFTPNDMACIEGYSNKTHHPALSIEPVQIAVKYTYKSLLIKALFQNHAH